jgi:hypothetical protein
MPFEAMIQLDFGVGSLLDAQVRWAKGTQFGCQFQEPFNLKLLQQPPKASPSSAASTAPNYLASGDSAK